MIRYFWTLPLLILVSLLAAGIRAEPAFAREEQDEADLQSITIQTPDGMIGRVNKAEYLAARHGKGDPTVSMVLENGRWIAAVARDSTAVNESEVPTERISCGAEVKLTTRMQPGTLDALFAPEEGSRVYTFTDVQDLTRDSFKGAITLGNDGVRVLDAALETQKQESAEIETETEDQQSPFTVNPADQRVIEKEYAQVTPPILLERLTQATGHIRELQGELESIPFTPIEIPESWEPPPLMDLASVIEAPDRSPASPQQPPVLTQAERFRYQRLLSNALDQAEEAKRALEELQKNPSLASEPEILAQIPAVRDLFTDPAVLSPVVPQRPRSSTPSPSSSAAASALSSSDALIKRTVLMAGLPPAAQSKTSAAMGNKVSLPSGRTLLHSGEIASARRKDPKQEIKNAITEITQTPLALRASAIATFAESVCTRYAKSLVKQAIHPETRKLSLTTGDYRAIWIYRKTGFFPKVPHYDPARKKILTQIADQFDAIDLYEHQSLSPGDLLVYRLAWEPSGHAYWVKGFEPVSKQVQVVELPAMDSAPAKRESFSLALQSPSKPGRLLASVGQLEVPGTPAPPALKPGYYALRLRPVEVSRCIERVSSRLASAIGPAKAPKGVSLK